MGQRSCVKGYGEMGVRRIGGKGEGHDEHGTLDARRCLYTGKETRERRQGMEKDGWREQKMKNEERTSEGRKGRPES